MKPSLKEEATEYYQRTLIAKDCAERCDCPETRAYLLDLEQFWFPRLSGTTMVVVRTKR